MKAILQERFGTANELHLGEAPAPIPDATSVLVKVHAASINALDLHYMTGEPFIGRLFAFGVRKPKRSIRGVDVSGVVASVSHPNSPFREGDAVFGLGAGSFAEYVAADERELALKPDAVPFEEAATLGVAAFTALQAVRDHGALQPGQTILIYGAASGVGTFAVQLAKWIGGVVTAVTSTPNVELVAALGADAVVDYTREDATAIAGEFDVIVDVSGLYSIGRIRRRLKTDGRLVIVGSRGGMGRLLGAVVTARLGRGRVKTFIAKCRPKDLQLLGELASSGKLRPVIQRTYPLERAPLAMAEGAKWRAHGKLVISVVGPAPP